MAGKLKFFIMKIVPCLLTFAILLYFCFAQNSFITLMKVFPKLNIFYFFCAILSMVVFWVTDSLIIEKILPNRLKSKFEYFKLTMSGQFYGAITPFASGSQPAQVLFLNQRGVSAGRSISVLSQKFFISQLCVVLISSLSILFKSQNFRNKIPGFTFLTLLGLTTQFTGIVMVVLFYKYKNHMMSLIQWLLRIFHKFKFIKDSKKLNKKIEDQLTFFLKNNFSINYGPLIYIYCLIQNISLHSVTFFIAKSFGCEGFPIFDMLAAQVFITLLSAVNPLPGAAGTTEGSFLLILQDFFSRPDILPAMILCRLINYYLSILVGFITININNKATKC